MTECSVINRGQEWRWVAVMFEELGGQIESHYVWLIKKYIVFFISNLKVGGLVVSH